MAIKISGTTVIDDSRNGENFTTITVNSSTPFYQNSQTISSNYTITNGFNAMSIGPITISSGVTVTVGSGENWVIV